MFYWFVFWTSISQFSSTSTKALCGPINFMTLSSAWYSKFFSNENHTIGKNFMLLEGGGVKKDWFHLFLAFVFVFKTKIKTISNNGNESCVMLRFQVRCVPSVVYSRTFNLSKKLDSNFFLLYLSLLYSDKKCLCLKIV